MYTCLRSRPTDYRPIDRVNPTGVESAFQAKVYMLHVCINFATMVALTLSMRSQLYSSPFGAPPELTYMIMIAYYLEESFHSEVVK